jgi:soluble lytic murein transglycosylase
LKVFQAVGEESKDPRLSADLVFMQGQALRGLQDWPGAARAFSRAAEIHSLLADYALFFQGEAGEKMEEGEKSLESYRSLIAGYPQSLLVAPTRLKMAEIFLQRGNFPSAAETCEEILKGPPWKDSSAQARFLLAQAREGLGQWPEAVKTYQELWLKNPLHENAKKARARWEALAKEKKITAEPISREDLFHRALQFYQAGSFEIALRELNQIGGAPLQSYPVQYAGDLWIDDLYFHRGLCHFRLKQYSKAMENFDLIVRHARNEGMAEKSLFWMFQAQVRSGRKEEALHTQSLLEASYPRSPFLAQAWYLKAAVYEEMGEAEKAASLYRQMADQFPQSPFRFAALWNAGWLGYQGSDFSAALQAWERLSLTDPPSRWMEKVLYWKGRTLEKMNRPQEAEENYRKLLRDFPASYYSQMVSSRGRALSVTKGPFPPPQDRPLAPFLKGKTNFSGTKVAHLEKGRLLARLTLLPLAVEELEAAEGEGANLEEIWMEISRLYREAEEFYRSNLLVRRKFALKPLINRPSEKEQSLCVLAYPLGNPSLVQRYSQDRNLDPSLLFALILEESRYQVQAVSPAGARGLMQVMPQTGRQIAKELKIRRFSEGQLFDPAVNIRLGSWYFARMLEEFGGKVHLALAAYNAGPHMVRKWLAAARSSAEDEFVENIPYTETRNYVIRVMGSAQVYRFLYWPQPGKPAQP